MVPPNVKIETIQKTDLAVVVEVVPDEEVADGHPHLLVRPLHAAVPSISAEGGENNLLACPLILIILSVNQFK